MQYLLTDDEHKELLRKASLVSVYAEELKRLNNITSNEVFSKYAKRLIAERAEKDRKRYYDGNV